VLFALIGAFGVVAVLVAAAMSLFVRRHGEADRPEPGWVPTDEVFRDPVNDRMIRVWADPAGRRHYLPERPEAGHTR
jgi:hypothetical protein